MYVYMYLVEEHFGDLVVAHLGRLEERRDVVRPHLQKSIGKSITRLVTHLKYLINEFTRRDLVCGR